MTTQAQKTIYRFIRVPDMMHQNSNTVVLIKPETTIARVQKITSSNNNNINNQQQQQEQQLPQQTVSIKLSTTENGNSNEKKIKTRRDDYRRFQHNLIERARREKINNWIIQLGKIIDDDNSDDDNTNSNNNHSASKNGGEALSKGGILEKACEYITHLKSIIKQQRESSSEESLHDEVRKLQDENDKLKLENAVLKRKYEIDDLDDDDILLKRSKPDTDVFNSLIEFSDSLPGDENLA